MADEPGRRPSPLHLRTPQARDPAQLLAALVDESIRTRVSAAEIVEVMMVARARLSRYALGSRRRIDQDRGGNLLVQLAARQAAVDTLLATRPFDVCAALDAGVPVTDVAMALRVHADEVSRLVIDPSAAAPHGS